MSQSVIASGTNGTSPLPLTLTAGAAVGERVLVGIQTLANTSFSIADSKSNTWVLKYSIINGNGSTNLRLYETVVTNALVTSDTITFTMTGTTTSNVAIAVKITDTLDSTRPVDRVGGFTAGGTITNWVTELGVPSSDDFIAVCFATNSSARTNTAASPWTELTESAGTSSRPLSASVVDSNTVQSIAAGGTFSSSGANTYSVGIVYRKLGYTLNTADAVQEGYTAQEGSFGAELTPDFPDEGAGDGGAEIPTQGQLWPRGSG